MATENSRYFTYIVRCSGGYLYTGYTNNLVNRIKQHNQGKGAKYTRGRAPVELVYSEELASKSLAMIREAQIKKLTKAQKLKLINGEQNEL